MIYALHAQQVQPMTVNAFWTAFLTLSLSPDMRQKRQAALFHVKVCIPA